MKYFFPYFKLNVYRVAMSAVFPILLHVSEFPGYLYTLIITFTSTIVGLLRTRYESVITDFSAYIQIRYSKLKVQTKHRGLRKPMNTSFVIHSGFKAKGALGDN